MKVKAVTGVTHLALQIPDDLAHSLQAQAAEQNKSIEQFAVERRQSIVDLPGSRDAVLRAVRQPPHVTPDAVDDLEAAILHGRSPVRTRGVFES